MIHIGFVYAHLRFDSFRFRSSTAIGFLIGTYYRKPILDGGNETGERHPNNTKYVLCFFKQ